MSNVVLVAVLEVPSHRMGGKSPTNLGVTAIAPVGAAFAVLSDAMVLPKVSIAQTSDPSYNVLAILLLAWLHHLHIVHQIW